MGEGPGLEGRNKRKTKKMSRGWKRSGHTEALVACFLTLWEADQGGRENKQAGQQVCGGG